MNDFKKFPPINWWQIFPWYGDILKSSNTVQSLKQYWSIIFVYILEIYLNYLNLKVQIFSKFSFHMFIGQCDKNDN